METTNFQHLSESITADRRTMPLDTSLSSLVLHIRHLRCVGRFQCPHRQLHRVRLHGSLDLIILFPYKPVQFIVHQRMPSCRPLFDATRKVHGAHAPATGFIDDGDRTPSLVVVMQGDDGQTFIFLSWMSMRRRGWQQPFLPLCQCLEGIIASWMCRWYQRRIRPFLVRTRLTGVCSIWFAFEESPFVIILIWLLIYVHSANRVESDWSSIKRRK